MPRSIDPAPLAPAGQGPPMKPVSPHILYFLHLFVSARKIALIGL
jgi:hypothetical protein